MKLNFPLYSVTWIIYIDFICNFSLLYLVAILRYSADVSIHAVKNDIRQIEITSILGNVWWDNMHWADWMWILKHKADQWAREMSFDIFGDAEIFITNAEFNMMMLIQLIQQSVFT